MTDFPETRDSLLLQVRSPDNREAWQQFVQLYEPIILRLARARGLQDADANDLSQRVLLAVASAICQWEKANETVRFRHWLRRIIRNAILNAISRTPRDMATGGTSIQELLAQHPDNDVQSTSDLELEYRRELYLRASRSVRSDVDPDTWRAFEMTVVEGQPIETAAQMLGKSVGTIYAARSRIVRRLREAVRELEQLEL